MDPDPGPTLVFEHFTWGCLKYSVTGYIKNEKSDPDYFKSMVKT